MDERMSPAPDAPLAASAAPGERRAGPPRRFAGWYRRHVWPATAALILLVFATGFVTLQLVVRDRVGDWVTVAGLELQGQTAASARETLARDLVPRVSAVQLQTSAHEPLTLTLAQLGMRADAVALERAIEASVVRGKAYAGPVPMKAVPPQVSTADAEARAGVAAMYLARPVTLRYRERTVVLSPREMAGMLSVNTGADADTYPLTFRNERAAARLHELFSWAETPPVDARLEVHPEGGITVTPSKVGEVLDMKVLLEDLDDTALGMHLDACVHGRGLRPGEELVEPGGGALVAEGQRVGVGVSAGVDAEHAGHLPGTEHQGPLAVAERDRPREIHGGHAGARLGVGRAHLRRHGLHRHRPRVGLAAHHAGLDGALEGDAVGRRAVPGRHDRDAVAARGDVEAGVARRYVDGRAHCLEALLVGGGVHAHRGRHVPPAAGQPHLKTEGQPVPAARQGGLGGRRHVHAHAELRERERERLVGARLELHRRHAWHEVARKRLAGGRGAVALQLEARDRDSVADTVAHHELQRHEPRREHEKDQRGSRRPDVAPVPPGEAPRRPGPRCSGRAVGRDAGSASGAGVMRSSM